MRNISAISHPNNTSSPSTGMLPFKTEGVALCSALSLETVLIVVGNLLTIFLFAVNKKLRKRSLVLVLNMAFADLMLGAVSLPMYTYLNVGPRFQLWTVKVEISLHIFSSVIEIIFSQTSLISAAMISVERLYAIYWPLRHRRLSTQAYHIAILMVWTLAILFSTVINLSYYVLSSIPTAIYIWISYTLTLLFIVCGCNIAIWRKVQRRQLASHSQNRAFENQRLTNTVLLFVSIFPLLTWLPLCILNYLIWVRKIPIHLTIYYISLFLSSSYFFTNPIVYVLRIPEFRQTLGWCCLRRQPLTVPKNKNANDGKQNKVAVLTPMTQLITLGTNPNHLQLSFEQEVMDTKL